jgi:hypothetical protein
MKTGADEMTSETKTPQPEEFWLTRGGERRYVVGILPGPVAYPIWSTDVSQSLETHSEGGLCFEGKNQEDDLVTHLPWCTSWDDVEPHPICSMCGVSPVILGTAGCDDCTRFAVESVGAHVTTIPGDAVATWPKWYVRAEKTLSHKFKEIAYSRMDSEDSGETFHTDGTSYKWNHNVQAGWIQCTKAEALARLNPSPAKCTAVESMDCKSCGDFCDKNTLPPCPDCTLPLTAGHADVCPMAWVVQDRVPVRVGSDEYRYSECAEASSWQTALGEWEPHVKHGYVSKFNGILSVRCRRRDLPPTCQNSATESSRPENVVTVTTDPVYTLGAASREPLTFAEARTSAQQIMTDQESRRSEAVSQETEPQGEPVKTDTPDPGDGWRLINQAVDFPNGCEQCWNPLTREWCSRYELAGTPFWGGSIYRRRITPAEPIHPLGAASREPKTALIQFMVPRRILDDTKCDWPVRACLAGVEVIDSATWIPVTIDKLGNVSVRKDQQQ